MAGKESDGEVQPSQRCQKGAVQGERSPLPPRRRRSSSPLRRPRRRPEEGCCQAPASAPTAATRAAPAKKTAAKATKAHAAPDGKKAVEFDRQGAEQPSREVAVQREVPRTAAQALLTERATYTRQAFNLQAEADSLVADFEPGDVQFDEESGEGDTLNIERERDLALSAQARAQVEEIDHALAKFELGTYGICEVSGEPVPEERLEAIPWARQRVQYKTGGLGRR